MIVASRICSLSTPLADRLAEIIRRSLIDITGLSLDSIADLLEHVEGPMHR